MKISEPMNSMTLRMNQEHPILSVVMAVFCIAFSSCDSEGDLGFEERTGWPHSAAELVAHLNSWEKKELIEHANGQGNAETKRWVSLHLEQIRAAGRDAIWVEVERRYVL